MAVRLLMRSSARPAGRSGFVGAGATLRGASAVFARSAVDQALAGRRTFRTRRRRAS
jgi:hypothetical protein